MIGIILPSLAYSQPMAAIGVALLSVGNYVIATRIVGGHKTPLGWLAATLLATALSFSMPSNKRQ